MKPGLRRICLVGVRGVGKTTLIRSVAQELPDVDHIVGSAVLREVAGEEFARFDELPHEVKHRHREAAVRRMEERQRREQRHVLCDGHTALLDMATRTAAPVFTDLDRAFFRELVLIEAPVDVILARRKGDPSKRRALDPYLIQAELEGEREVSRATAEAAGMILHVLPPNIDEAARSRLLEILR